MTAKAKAEELIRKFTVYTLSDFSDENFEQTKNCTLICVDEMLKLKALIDRDYWKEVKQEIEKL